MARAPDTFPLRGIITTKSVGTTTKGRPKLKKNGVSKKMQSKGRSLNLASIDRELNHGHSTTENDDDNTEMF